MKNRGVRDLSEPKSATHYRATKPETVLAVVQDVAAGKWYQTEIAKRNRVSVRLVSEISIAMNGRLRGGAR